MKIQHTTVKNMRSFRKLILKLIIHKNEDWAYWSLESSKWKRPYASL